MYEITHQGKNDWLTHQRLTQQTQSIITQTLPTLTRTLSSWPQHIPKQFPKTTPVQPIPHQHPLLNKE